MDSIFDKLTTHCKSALKNAFSLALASGHKSISPQHVLYALSQQKGSIAAQILIKAKITPAEIKESLRLAKPTKAIITSIGLTPTAKRMLERSFIIANANQHRFVGTEHLLASLLTVNDASVIQFLTEKKINLDELRHQVETILLSTSRFPDVANSPAQFQEERSDDVPNGIRQPVASQTATLELFATNLTDPTIQTRIDPVIGRQEEISRVIQILSRRNKNNPLLLGDPGVGKTAIVEGLAKKIVEGSVPEILRDKKIYSLDLTLVVAGTSFRGEFESRLKQIISEVKRDPRIVLFIDEIHNIIGIGAAAGSMDAANILKPALARGEIRCIGATTTEEYKKYIESDPALERRFQTVAVNQPSIEQTIEILNGIKGNYEAFHQVKITPAAVESAARLSERYIADRFLPDKAIDIIDEAASAIKIQQISDPLIKEWRDIETQLQAVVVKKEAAVSDEKFSAALALSETERQLRTQAIRIKQTLDSTKQKIVARITDADIATVVAKMTGIPVVDLILEEKKYLLNLENELEKKIIDQNEAIHAVAEFIRRSRTGITDSRRPIGSFIFLGPSGVGKTELAKILAEMVFGSSQSLIKIDMSEFAEGFNISKLIGAPAGYVGYKDGAKLTDSVKRRPYAVVLFDEIEKAHRQIFHLLLQVLEDGYLTDAAGKKINFRNTIIIMTSNIGSESFTRQAAIGFQAESKSKRAAAEKSFAETEREVLSRLKDKFQPEFLSRVDKVVVFQPLARHSILKITKIQLDELCQRLERQNILFHYSPSVIKYIADKSYAPEVGARAIRKTIQDEIEGKIAQKILSGKKTKKRKIVVALKHNTISIT